MAKYAIKHKPTGKYFYEDEGGSFLVEKEQLFGIDPSDECCAIWEIKEDADEILDDMKSYTDGIVWLEDGEFPVSEFEVTSI